MSTPTVAAQVGKLKVDDGKDKENVKSGTLNPEFFRSFEFLVTMPGESQLKLKASPPVFLARSLDRSIDRSIRRSFDWCMR